MKKPAAKMSGITLLETMLALALGAVILMGAVIFYQSTRQNAAVSKALSDMNAIKAGYKAYLASGFKLNATSDAAQLQAVQEAGFLPNPLMDPWGQPYTVSLTKTSGYIIIGIPGIGSSPGDPNCKALWAAVQTIGGISTTITSSYQCGFGYRFP